MATLRLYSDIVGEEEKVFLQAWGLDGICYKDINEFLNSIPEDDDVIDIRIHCRGGSCIEGWAMYDALRRSKKKIYTTVEGECSSMATIILLAAPLERRTAYKNAHFCIHNPSVMGLDTDYPRRLTADSLNNLTEQIRIQEKALRDEQERIIELYTSRTKAGRKELQDIMNQDTYITAKKAMELGFICKTLATNTAKKVNPHKNRNIMSKPQTSVAVRKSLLDRLLAKCGVSSLEDVVMRDQVVTAADGSEFTVEREDGDPQVGDVAYPDGTYTLDDGTVIVIEDNLITSITEPEKEEQEPAPEENVDPDDPNAEGEGEGSEETPTEEHPAPNPNEDDLTKRVTELETQVSELEKRVADLEAERDGLQEQIDAKKDARVLTEDEKSVLASVAKNGGREWLDGVVKLRSTFHPENRRYVDHKDTAPEGETKTQRAIREQKERYAAFKK